MWREYSGFAVILCDITSQNSKLLWGLSLTNSWNIFVLFEWTLLTFKLFLTDEQETLFDTATSLLNRLLKIINYFRYYLNFNFVSNFGSSECWDIFHRSYRLEFQYTFLKVFSIIASTSSSRERAISLSTISIVCSF